MPMVSPTRVPDCGSCSIALLLPSLAKLVMALSAGYAVRLTGSILQTLGIFLTAWRIYIRLRIRRFWWEDAWAATLMVLGPLFIITQWMFLLTHGLTAIGTQWIYSICYTSIVMLVRMSVLFAVIRIIHRSSRLLKFTYACVVYFAVCWLILIVEKAVQCASYSSWHDHNSVCPIKPFISIFQLTTDCIAVAILVVLPLRILWNVKLPRRQRRMILSIFASSVVLAFGALFHTTGQILNVGVVMAAGINAEVALSLWVCNLLVVVTFTYRVLLPCKRAGSSRTTATDDTCMTNDDDDDDDDFTTQLSPRGVTVEVTSMSLTTVDLDIPTASCRTAATSVV